MVWRESDDAIGDLMRCKEPLLGAASLDIPQKVQVDWWEKRNIRISPNPLSREDLFTKAASARNSDDQNDLVDLLWHILAWGVVGDFRNAARIVADAQSESGRLDHLLAALQPAAKASYRGDIEAAYRAFVMSRISRLGRGFFTKFLYFTSNPSSANPRCMIIDSRVTSAIFTLTGNGYLYRENAHTYERACHDLFRWADTYRTTAEAIEFRLYKFGQLIKNTRWRWLHGQVSLYRDGIGPAQFDDIVRRVAADDL